MKSTIEMTGGFYVMTSSFGDPVFKESFKKFFEVDEENEELKMGFLASLQVFTTTEDFKVRGVIGQVAPIKATDNKFYSSDEIGVGNTNHWYLGGVDQNKSLAVYFDVTSTQTLKQPKKIHLQFQTAY